MRLEDEGAGEEGSRQKEQPVLRRNCRNRAEGDGRAQIAQGLGSQLEMLSQEGSEKRNVVCLGFEQALGRLCREESVTSRAEQRQLAQAPA